MTNFVFKQPKQLTSKQKRMRDAITFFQNYLKNYAQHEEYLDNDDNVFINNMIYAIGVALHGDEFSFPNLYKEFQIYLKEEILNITHNHKTPNVTPENLPDGTIF